MEIGGVGDLGGVRDLGGIGGGDVGSSRDIGGELCGGRERRQEKLLPPPLGQRPQGTLAALVAGVSAAKFLLVYMHLQTV